MRQGADVYRSTNVLGNDMPVATGEGSRLFPSPAAAGAGCRRSGGVRASGEADFATARRVCAVAAAQTVRIARGICVSRSYASASIWGSKGPGTLWVPLAGVSGAAPQTARRVGDPLWNEQARHMYHVRGVGDPGGGDFRPAAPQCSAAPRAAWPRLCRPSWHAQAPQPMRWP